MGLLLKLDTLKELVCFYDFIYSFDFGKTKRGNFHTTKKIYKICYYYTIYSYINMLLISIIDLLLIY